MYVQYSRNIISFNIQYKYSYTVQCHISSHFGIISSWFVRISPGFVRISSAFVQVSSTLAQGSFRFRPH